MPDDELVALATKELAILGLVDPADVEAGYVVRMPKAYPYYDFDATAPTSRRIRRTGSTSMPPTSTRSGGTGCTSTTIRTIRCTRPC